MIISIGSLFEVKQGTWSPEEVHDALHNEGYVLGSTLPENTEGWEYILLLGLVTVGTKIISSRKEPQKFFQVDLWTPGYTHHVPLDQRLLSPSMGVVVAEERIKSALVAALHQPPLNVTVSEDTYPAILR
jgi:hypothetical protein